MLIEHFPAAAHTHSIIIPTKQNYCECALFKGEIKGARGLPASIMSDILCRRQWRSFAQLDSAARFRHTKCSQQSSNPAVHLRF